MVDRTRVNTRTSERKIHVEFINQMKDKEVNQQQDILIKTNKKI